MTAACLTWWHHDLVPQQPSQHQVLLTLREFSEIPYIPMTEHQLRHLVRALGWQPAGLRHDGRGGHPRQTFGADDLRRAYAAVASLLGSGYHPA